MIGTIGVAQSVCCTGVRISWVTNLSSSASTNSPIAYGTDLALQNLGGTVRSLALESFIVPNSGLKTSGLTVCN